MYHHINQPRKRVDVVEMGKNCVQKSRNSCTARALRFRRPKFSIKTEVLGGGGVQWQWQWQRLRLTPPPPPVLPS